MSKINFFFIHFFILFLSTTFSQPDTITILHVNDSHSTLEAIGPRDENLDGTLGGISRVATLVGITKMTEPNVLFLHAGDISIGDVFFNRNFHVPELQILDALGVDAMTLGNHEFDLGPLALLGSLMYTFPTATDAFPILTANVDFSDPTISGLEEYVDAYTVKEFGDLKIGIFGLTTPSTNLLSNPYPAVVSEDIVTIAATMVGTLRTVENCDVIILLSHLGVNLDQLIVSYVPGINVIVGGHDHYKYDEPIPITNPLGGTTWVAQARSNYMYIGKMQLTVDALGTIALLNYSLIPLNENVPEEPTVKAMVDGMIADIETFYSTPFFTQPFGYADAFHKEEALNLFSLGAHDTPIGNLVTDAFRNYTGTDIAIHAGGSIALPLWEGPFTMSDIFRINGYGFNTVNTLGFQLATFKMTGEALWMGLEFGLSQIESNDEYFIQVSGLEYKYDGTKPAGQRVVSVIINGKLVNPTKLYSITASEMVLAILDYTQIPYSDPNILIGVTEFEAVVAHVMALNNFLHPKEIGRVINVGDRLAANRIKADGWFNSEPGNYLPDPTVSGQFNFKANLHKTSNNNLICGEVKLKFPEAGINMTSTRIECLLIENNVITIRGKCRNIGRGKYGFLITAIDAGNSGDLIKLTIWDRSQGDKVIYDNLTFNSLGGGYIKILQSQFAKEMEENTSPENFVLQQNYPNPFNPTTKIEYQIADFGFASLKVYDILGNEVATLVSENKAPGIYEVQFNASQLASGVYIYSLRAGGFTQTKKMVLMR